MFFDFTLENFAKRLDKRTLPRPANEQFLSSYRALMRLSKDVSTGASYWLIFLIECALIMYAADTLRVGLFSPGGALLGTLFALCLTGAIVDTTKLKLAYAHVFQSETHGSGRWADVAALKALKMLTKRSDDPLPEAIPLALFGWRYVLTLPLAILAEHIVFFGPPGSGKSASFFMNLARAFSHVGGMVALDVKGELYRFTAYYYKNVYRFDLKNPEFSDRLQILGPCKGNGKRAGQVASYMIGYDENAQSGGENPFWPKAATLMLKCLILHLCTLMDEPTPADVFEFIAAHPTIQQGPVTINQLAIALEGSADQDAQVEWGATFSQLDPKTMSNVIVTMNAMLAPFRDPNVRDVLRMPTEAERRRGCRVINFHDLRRKGTAIFVVVPEGEASRLSNVVATLFAMATDVLRETGDDPEACYSLVMLDEAGNVPLRGLSEGVGVGRGRKMIFALGYQNISQPEKQYGRATAFSILQSIGARFFLPGLTGETAEWAVKMIGRTTALQRQSTDAVGDALDNERLSEVGTDMLPANELRQMLRYNQAVAVINNAPPIRIGFPPNAKDVDTRECNPRQFADKEDLESHVPAAFSRPSAVELPEDGGGGAALPAAEDALLVTATPEAAVAGGGQPAPAGATAAAEDGAEAGGGGAAAAGGGAVAGNEGGEAPARDAALEAPHISPASQSLADALNANGARQPAATPTQTVGPFDVGTGGGGAFNFAEFSAAQNRLNGAEAEGDLLHLDGDLAEAVSLGAAVAADDSFVLDIGE